MEREFFTRHGLHLNRKGKEKMAEKLASAIHEIM
jgi:lysophospholipase L1-like esterase